MGTGKINSTGRKTGCPLLPRLICSFAMWISYGWKDFFFFFLILDTLEHDEDLTLAIVSLFPFRCNAFDSTDVCGRSDSMDWLSR